MASTNKTGNIQLNQWVAEDPVLMEDFNADNQKLDAAIGEIKQGALLKKLLDITVTTSGVKTVELNLSGIDLSKFQRLYLYVDNSGLTQFYMRVNKNTGTYRANSVNAQWDNVNGYSMFNDCFCDFFLVGESLSWMNFRTHWKPPADITSRNLSTLDIMRDNTMINSFTIGTRFILTGMMK